MVLESPGKRTQKGPGKSWKNTFSVLYAPCTSHESVVMMMMMMMMMIV